MEKGGCRSYLLLALSVILIGCPSNVVTFTTGHRNATFWYHTTPVYETVPADMGHVRLVGGQRPTEGIVEIQINGEWGTVCDDNFDHNAARVVCNQLGYHGSNVTALQTGPSYFIGGYTYLSNTSTPIWMDNFRCSGHESRLVSCTRYNNFGQHDCGHQEDAGVDCLGYAHVPYNQYSTTPYYWHTTNYWGTTSHNEPLRLVGGSRPTEGRVEIYHNGLWGTVCDDYFHVTDAEVVCRQLGYYFSQAPTVQDQAFYGAGSGTIWMDDVQCRGTEYRLTDCPFAGFGHHNCGHGEDVGVDCLGYEHGNGSYTTTQQPLTNITHGATLLLTATPQDVMTGVTPSLTLTCAPGYRDDLSRIFLIQINLLHGNGSKTAVADIDSGQTARVVDGHQRTSVRGFIPYQSYQQSQAYLTVTINSPTVEDCGQWECTLSGLNSHNLMVTETAETIVHVSSLEGLAGELGGLRDELHAAESTINDLKNTIDELQGHKGQGFTAFLISNYTATHGRLPFQREAVDTMGGFSNSVLNPPVDGLYVLTLTVSVNRGHRVTVALRHDGQTLLTLIAKGDNDSEGQASASEVVALQANHPVDVEVVDYSYGSILLASPSTLLSGYLLS